MTIHQTRFNIEPSNPNVIIADYFSIYHKGSRTHEAFAPEEIQRKFETLMGKQIYNWNHEAYPNGVFQYCTAEDKIVYHMDTQTYAAVVYLTPDAPPECGTSFFRSKINKIKKDPNDENLLMEIFNKGFYDKTQFELIDVIGNVYNRLVIWDATLIHAASEYFGQEKQDSRLFHMFFFDA